MRLLPTKARLPGIIALISLIAIFLTITLSSPFDKIGYAILFFILLTIFLLSFGYFLAVVQFGKLDSRGSYRLILATISIVILLMFRSTQSLTWVDALVLVLITFGLLFYTSKRSS